MRAEALARALAGRRVGRGWVACCPAHRDRTPSLSINEDRDTILVHCFGGCSQGAVRDALKARGLWHGWPRERVSSGAESRKLEDSNQMRTRAALRIWRSAQPAGEALVEVYLRSRGLRGCVPPTLRFHPALRHGSGQTAPAMVGLVTLGADNTPVAVHRTYLRPDGTAKAELNPNKMSFGPVRGAAVRLDTCGKRLAVAEGIETGLSVQQASGAPSWAALSAGGIKSLVLPPLPTAAAVTIAADPDPVGLAAAYAAAERWHAEGRQVRIATPPVGLDFNDLLRTAP
jgi:putative DNA primase/helicase